MGTSYNLNSEGKNRAGGAAQVVERLSSKCAALSSNPGTIKKKKRTKTTST
jgi:hypothetical protein